MLLNLRKKPQRLINWLQEPKHSKLPKLLERLPRKLHSENSLPIRKPKQKNNKRLYLLIKKLKLKDLTQKFQHSWNQRNLFQEPLSQIQREKQRKVQLKKKLMLWLDNKNKKSQLRRQPRSQHKRKLMPMPPHIDMLEQPEKEEKNYKNKTSAITPKMNTGLLTCHLDS